MVIQYTADHHIPYLDDATSLNELDTVTREVAQLLDAAMSRAGYVPPDTATFVQLANKVTALQTRADNLRTVLNACKPVVYVDQTQRPGNTTPQAAPGPHVIHPKRVIDPAAIFGPGFGCVVMLDQSVLGDLAANVPSAAWYANILAADLVNTGVVPGTPTATIKSSFMWLTQPPNRVQTSHGDSYVIPAGKVGAFLGQLASPGNPSTATVTIYGDPTSNRLKYTVIPTPPTVPV